MHDSLLTKEGASETDDESTSARGGGEVVDELEDRLAPLTGLDVAWGFDLDAFFQERAQQARAAGDAGDGTVKTMGSSQGGAMSSVPEGSAESDPGASAASGIDQGNGEDPPRSCRGGQHTRYAAGDGSP